LQKFVIKAKDYEWYKARDVNPPYKKEDYQKGLNPPYKIRGSSKGSGYGYMDAKRL